MRSARKASFATGALLMLAVAASGQPMSPTGREMGDHGHMGHMHGEGMMGMSMVRHQYVMRNGIPPAYRDLHNPIEPTPETLAAGRKVYEANCAVCHGPQGHGDGPGAKGLSPPPANIAALVRMRPMATDAYLAWTIGEGGVPVGSAMPAFKSILSETERWQLIRYLQQDLGR
jgi:mono/diheme cytochrome c family protein